MLAAIPGELIGVLIFAVAALLKWLGDRASEQQKQAAPPPLPRPESSPAGSTRGRTAEEERVRKFMEALGLPSEDEVRPSAEPSAPLRPAPVAERAPQPVEPRTRPIPPIVFEDPAERRRRKKARREVIPPPIPAPVPVHETAPVVVVASAPAVQAFAVAAEHRPAEVQALQGLSIGDVSEERAIFWEMRGSEFRDELRNPVAVRRAIVLREILGAPPGLQPLHSIPTFRSL